RVEFVPKSIAATAPIFVPSTMVAFLAARAALGRVVDLVQVVGHPAADRIVTACQVPRVVRVQALDAPTRAADATRGAWAGVIGWDPRIALGGVAGVRRRDRIETDLGLGAVDAAGGLEATHEQSLTCADEPVARRHGGAVGEERLVADDDRAAALVAGDDLVAALRLSTEQRGDRPVVGLVALGVHERERST